LTRRCLVAIAASVAFGAPVLAQDKSIAVASTTSTQDSGLFGHSVSSILISSTVATMPMH
jgi:tungstate transport system substrate-binding protein